MQPASDAFKAHASGNVRQPRTAVRVTWPAGVSLPTDITGAVESVTVSRDLTGGLPVETSLVEGVTSSETTVVLSGQFSDGRKPLREMHPYRNGAAMQNQRIEGQPIETDFGFELSSGVELIPAHRGKVRSMKLDQGNGTVTLTALDYAERLRAAVSLPAWGVYTNPFGESGPATNLQWVVDYALRRNGVYSSLAIRSQDYSGAEYLAAPWDYIMGYTGHGSVCPDVGVSVTPMYGSLSDPTSVYVPGKWGLAATGPTREMPTILGTLAGGQDATLFEGYVKCGSGDTGTTTVSIGSILSVQLAAGTAKVTHSPGGTVTAFALTGAPSWRYVQLLAYSDAATTFTGVRWSLRVGTQTASGTWTGQSQVSQGLEVTTGDLPWQALQCYSSSIYGWFDPVTFAPISPTATDRSSWNSPGAVLDTSTQWVLNLPKVTAKEAWSLIGDVAAAELAYTGFDESGVFRYRTRAALTGTISETITTDQVSRIGVSVWLDAIRDSVQATYTPQFVVTDQLGPDPGKPSPSGVLSAGLGTKSDAVRVPAGAVTYSTITNTSQWWPQTTTVFPWSFGGQAWDTTGFGVCKNASGSTEVPSGELSLIRGFLEPVDANTWRIRWSNSLGYTAYIVYPNIWAGLSDLAVGAPALRIFGAHVASTEEVTEARPEVMVRQTSTPILADRRVLDLGNSPWRGYRPALDTLLSGVLADTRSSRPRLDDIDVPANPARQLGDVLELADSAGEVANITARIVRIDRTWRDGVGARDTLSLRAVAPPGAWILGRSRLGIDTRLV